jgi:hypothetical protein
MTAMLARQDSDMGARLLGWPRSSLSIRYERRMRHTDDRRRRATRGKTRLSFIEIQLCNSLTCGNVPVNGVTAVSCVTKSP